MFGLGWTELLVIGVVALIVIGPKDLPVVMNRMGKMIASVRRMGNEFQREINKASGLEQITDLRKSITEPLKQTAADIRREFNTPLQGGGTAPSGAIKPKDPAAESVVEEIHEKLGMTPPAPTTAASTSAAPSTGPAPQPYTPFTKEAQEKYRAEQAGVKAPEAPKAVESPAPVEAIPPARKPRAPRKPKAQAVADTSAPTDPVASTPSADAPKVAKPRKPRVTKPQSEA